MSSVDLQTHAVLTREIHNEKLPEEVKEWLETAKGNAHTIANSEEWLHWMDPNCTPEYYKEG